MAAIITGNSKFPTAKQVPDHAIMDFYNKQAYLGNQFVASSGLVTLADASEHTILYLLNPTGGSLSLFNSIRKFFAGDLTNSVNFKLYITSTGVSAGSAITPTNSRIASATASIATCKKTPTVVGNGTLISTFPAGINSGLVDSSMLILDPGQSLLVTATGSAATSCAVEFNWYEL